MKRISLIIVLLAAFCALSASAQRDNRFHEKGSVTVINDETGDAAHVEKTFKSNAPTSTNDNGMPRFAILGKDKMFYLGIGAQFLGEAFYDIGSNVPSPVDFTPSAFTPATPGSRAGLGFGWQSSSIYLNFVAMPYNENRVGLFFKGNFLGDNNSFSAFHFYAKYRGLTFGYTNSLFNDGGALPMTLDFEGPNGYTRVTLFTAYWTQPFTDRLSGAIGIDEPIASVTTGGFTATVKHRLPSIPFYLQYAWAGGDSHVRLSGILCPMQYRDLADSRNRGMLGGGVQLSGATGIYGPLSLQFLAAYGKGIGSYIQDDEGLGLDAVAVGDGRMKTVTNLGISLGLTCTITPRLSSNLVYGHVGNWAPKHALTKEGQYRKGDYLALNLIYNINKYLAAGVEYNYGLRQAFDAESLHANRIQAQMSFTF